METIQKTEVEQIHAEHDAPSVSVEGDVSVSGAEALHGELGDIADGFDVAGFKCVKCGLAHMHDTTKHRSSDSFDVSETEAATGQDYNPNCHCGVNELARRGSDFGVDETRAASTARSAPIPDDAAREMNAQFGGL